MEEKDNSIEEILKRLRGIDYRLNSIEKFLKGEKEEEKLPEEQPLKEEKEAELAYQIKEEPEKIQKRERQKPATPKVPQKETPKKEPSITKVDKERIWINVLHKVGIFALAIGVGLFIKYSFPYIGLWGRIAIGLIIGIGLLYIGEKLMKNYGAYALGISSCGIIILYFSFYAASTFYDLIAPALAFLLMLFVTVTGVLLSLRYDSSVITFIALLGAFLTPSIFRGGKITPIALVILFTYITLINGWILTVTKLRKWKWLNILAFILTTIILISTINLSSKNGFALVFLTFSTIFFALFFYLSRREDAESYVIIFLNPFIYYFILWFVTYKSYPYIAGTLALALSVFYYYQGSRSERKKSLELAWSFSTLAIFFLTIAIPVFFKAKWSTLAWAVEGTAILSLGRKEKVLKILPLILLGIAVFKMFFIDYFLLELFPFFFNSIIIIAAVFLCAKFLSGKREGENKKIIAALNILGMFLIFWFSLTGTDKFFDKFSHLSEMRSLVTSLLWGIYSLALFIVGITKESSPAKIAGFIMTSLTIIKVFFYDLSYLETTYRILSFVVLGAILLIISFIYQRKIRKTHDIK